MIRWVAPATLTGYPAAAMPVGRSTAGLPIGLQVMITCRQIGSALISVAVDLSPGDVTITVA